MSHPTPRTGTIEGIQILRAVAALMVVFHHARHSIPGAEAWPGFGETGVDIFFVISGFVMAHTTRDVPVGQRLRACREFLLKRSVRVVPLYWLVLLWTSRRELALGAVSTDLLKDFAFVPHPSAVYPGQLWPSVVQGWTLNYEMFFYAVFGASLLVGTRRLVLVGGVLAGLVAIGAAADWQNAALRFYTDSILLEFGLGILLQRALVAGVLPRVSRGVSVAALLAGFTLLCATHGHGPRGLAQGVPSLLIVWASLGAFARLRLPTWERLGAASYAIYLVHWASFGAVKPVSAWLGPHAGEPVGAALLLFLLFAVAIVTGLAVHTVLERPFLRWSHAVLTPARPLRTAQAE